MDQEQPPAVVSAQANTAPVVMRSHQNASDLSLRKIQKQMDSDQQSKSVCTEHWAVHGCVCVLTPSNY